MNNNLFIVRMLFSLTILVGILLTLFFIRIPQVKADTEVGGPIISDTTWTLKNSPYIVKTESVTVNQGVKLTIQPGVTVRFNPGLKLWVNGTLVARGTASNPITFTSNQPNPIPGNWGNIDFRGTNINTIVDSVGNYISGNILQHCVIEYGGWDGLNYQNAIYVEFRSMLVDSCRIEHNLGSGIMILGNPDLPSWVTNNTLRDNRAWGLGGGVLLRYGVIKNNLITYNKADGGVDGGGIYASNADIINNIIGNNTTKQTPGTEGGGIFVEANLPGNFLIQGNIIQDNSAVYYGGGIYIKTGTQGAKFIVKENLIRGNSAVADGGGIYIRGQSGLVTLQDNIIIGNTADSDANNDGSGGGIYCEYVNGMHILQENVITENSAGERGGGVFTDYCDISGNIISNNNAVQGGGGIVSSGDILYNTISANSVISTTAMGAGVFLSGSGIFLYNSLIDNAGMPGSLTGGMQIMETPQVHHNNIYGNFPYNVVVETLPAYQISGALNYWDTDDVVDIQDGIYDNIDKGSRGEFVYNPYLTEQEFPVPLNPPSGLTASLNDTQVVLDWDMDPNFSPGWGYKVYYDKDSFLPPLEGQGLNEGDSPINVGNQTQVTLNGLEPYVNYYFAVTVYDDNGVESKYPIVVVDQPDEIPLIPSGLSATLNGDQVELEWDPDPNFSDGWSYEVSYDVDSYWPPYEGVGLDQGDSPINVGDQTSVVMSGLTPSIDYYFAVRVYDDLGTPSGYAIAIVEQPEAPPPILYLPIVWR